MDEQKDPRPDEEMQRQWREALDVDSFGNEHDIWLSGFNRGKQTAALSQLWALRDAVAALGGITSNNVPESVRAALSQPAAQEETIGGECQRLLMNEGKPYPRTCAVCGLFGPCHYGPQSKATP